MFCRHNFAAEISASEFLSNGARALPEGWRQSKTGTALVAAMKNASLCRCLVQEEHFFQNIISTMKKSISKRLPKGTSVRPRRFAAILAEFMATSNSPFAFAYRRHKAANSSAPKGGGTL